MESKAILFSIAVALVTTFASISSAAAPASRDLLKKVGFDQKIGAEVPLDDVFRDESGKPVKLGGYFDGKRPVVLALAYYKCPNLCTLVLNGLSDGLRGLPDTLGKDYDVVTVSIDPRETPRLALGKKRTYLARYARLGAVESSSGPWHFLTGGEAQIRRLAQAVGFRYFYDPVARQYAHPSGIVVFTPRGKISQYLFGIRFKAADLHRSLGVAARGDRGSVVDQILLYCFHYDPRTSKYGVLINRVLRTAGAITALALTFALISLFQKEAKT